MRHAALASLLIATFLMAGCGSKPGPSPAQSTALDTSMTSQTVGASAELPVWTKGQSWTYVVEIPGEETRTFRMAITGDRTESVNSVPTDVWIVSSGDRKLALHQALYSTNPVLGRISKATLSPKSSGEYSPMFSFPLTDGKTWSGKLLGQSMSFAADYAGDIDVSRVDASHGLGEAIEGFRIVASAANGIRVRYDYVEALEWFSSYEELNPKGERAIKLTLIDFDNSFSGSYWFYRGDDDNRLDRTVAHTDDQLPEASLVYNFTVGEKFKDRVGLGWKLKADSGIPPPSLNFTLRSPAGVVWSRDFVGDNDDQDWRDFPATPGLWSIEVNRIVGSVRLEFSALGIETFAEGTM